MKGTPDSRSELALLDEQIARVQARLDDVDRERGQLEQDLAGLRGRRESIARAEAASSHAPDAPSTRSAADKVALFRSLFAGRADVFPKHWHNPKTDRKDYSPACSNEWVKGVCDKPRVKCGEGPNQAFIPVTDRVVLDHLQGRHIAGVYPMLDDETCHFLAVDFDKDGWKDDVAAFVETCQRFDLPAAVERSRSGNGAHVWFFFGTRVPAVTARKMGCFLLTETMARRHELSMSSYDRLRVINCAEDLPKHVGLPRGCLVALQELLNEHQIELTLQDERTEGNPLDLEFNGSLTDLQKDVVRALLPHDFGVFVTPPGTGKTVVGTHLIAERARTTLVLVHRTQLLDQWRTQLALFLDLEASEIGQIGGGKRKANEKRFGRLRPEKVLSLEDLARERARKEQTRREEKAQRRLAQASEQKAAADDDSAGEKTSQ